MPSDDQEKSNFKPVPKTPDAVAVALHQPEASGRAPVVLASGRGTTAEQILQVAFALGIKVREDSDLAQILTTVNEESEIPIEAFTAVAEILVYLYQANHAATDIFGVAKDENNIEKINSIEELSEILAARWRQSGESGP